MLALIDFILILQYINIDTNMDIDIILVCNMIALFHYDKNVYV